MSKRFPRRKLFIDPVVQGAIVIRFLLYWCLCVFVVFATLICQDYLAATLGLFTDGPPGLWLRLGPAALVVMTLTPLLILDLLRTTNRFAGPIVRTRRFVRALAAGERVEPISFRRDDYWRGYADDLNAVLRRIEALDKTLVGKEDAIRSGKTDANSEDADADLVLST